MNIPGFTAEASLYNSGRQYYGDTTAPLYAYGVLPMGTCCSDCPTCYPCYSWECPPSDPGCCGSYYQCVANRVDCLRTCVNCIGIGSPSFPPCCPAGCQGTCS